MTFTEFLEEASGQPLPAHLREIIETQEIEREARRMEQAIARLAIDGDDKKVLF